MRKMQMTQQEKHVTFKKAFETFNEYLNGKNYIGAYVVAFSILEDRLTAAYMLLHDHLKEERPAPNNFKTLSEKLKLLMVNGIIGQSARDAFGNCAKDRNSKLHAAMWNLDAFSADDCQAVIKLAREADKLSRNIKKLT